MWIWEGMARESWGVGHGGLRVVPCGAGVVGDRSAQRRCHYERERANRMGAASTSTAAQAPLVGRGTSNDGRARQIDRGMAKNGFTDGAPGDHRRGRVVEWACRRRCQSRCRCSKRHRVPEW